MKKLLNLAAILAVSISLAACGGGGGSAGGGSDLGTSTSSPSSPQATGFSVSGTAITPSSTPTAQVARAARLMSVMMAATPIPAASNPQPAASSTVTDSTNGNAAVPDADVTLTNVTEKKTFNTTSDSSGHWSIDGLTRGNYTIDIHGKSKSGQNIWNTTYNQFVASSADLGDFALTSQPVLRSVTLIRAGRAPQDLPLTSSVQNGNNLPNDLVVGETVSLNIVAEDPNNLPITIQTGEAHSGLSISHTVTAQDLVASTFSMIAALTNNDSISAIQNANADLQVTVNFVQAVSVEGAVNNVSVNGKQYVPDPNHQNSVTTDPVDPNQPVQIGVDAAAVPNLYVNSYWDYNTGDQNSFTTNSYQIPLTPLKHVYALHSYVETGNQQNMQNAARAYLTVPLLIDDKPAQLSSTLTVNGLSVSNVPTDPVFHVGDVLSIVANGTDPNGRPITYRFAVLNGGTGTQTDWSTSNAYQYTLTDTDATSTFTLRVWVQNDDGRNVQSDYDQVFDYHLKVSQ